MTYDALLETSEDKLERTEATEDEMLEAALEAEFTLDEDEELEEADPATGAVGWPCPRQEELRFAGQLNNHA